MGLSDEIKGRVKEAAGVLTDNDALRHEGQADRATGRLKTAIDGVRRRAGEAVTALTRRMKKRA